MVCSDTHSDPVIYAKAHRGADAKLNALPPCLRKHFLASVQDNREMLEELAKM